MVRNRTLGLLCIAALASACTYNPTRFVRDYADLYCESVMACSDPDDLAFEGIASHEDCLGLFGPDLDAQAQRECTYKGGKARACIRRMKKLECPAEGVLLDEVLPEECGEIYTECEPVEDTDAGTQETQDTAI